MRYKFALNPKAKSYVEWTLEHYHEYKRQMEEYKRDMLPAITQSYSLAGGVKAGRSNPTEQAAIKFATNPYIITTERNIQAIEVVLRGLEKTDIDLIDLVYWRRSYNIIGAGQRVGLEKSAAYERINNIFCRIALEMGVVNI